MTAFRNVDGLDIGPLTGHLHRSRARLARVMARARDVSAGCDESGAVTVLLDEHGTGHDVVVTPDWRQRLALPQVGAALVAADTHAATRRAAATAEALAEASTCDRDGSTLDTGSGTVAPGWLTPVEPGAGSRRSLAELSAAVWAALDDIGHVTAPPPPAHGSGAHGAVRVTMALGRITGCAIDERWLTHQDDTTLAQALREALRAAAGAHAAARRPLIEYQQRLHDLIADARATIAQMPPGGPV